MADATVALPELVEQIARAALAVPARTLVSHPAAPGIAPHALAVSAARLTITLDITDGREGGFFFNARRHEGIAARLRIATALLPSLRETPPRTPAPDLRVLRPAWWLGPDRRGNVGVRLEDGGELRVGRDADGRGFEWFWPDVRNSIVEMVPEPGKPLAPLIGLIRRMADEPKAGEGAQERPLPENTPDGIARMVAVCRQLAEDWAAARRGVFDRGAPVGHHGALVLGGYELGPMEVRLEQPLDARLREAGPATDREEVISLGVDFTLPDRAGMRPSSLLRISPPDAFAGGALHAAFAAALRDSAGELAAGMPEARTRLRDPPHAVMRFRRGAGHQDWDENVILYDPGQLRGAGPMMMTVEARVAAGPVVHLRRLRRLGVDPDPPGGMPDAQKAAWRRIAAVLGHQLVAISAWMGARP